MFLVPVSALVGFEYVQYRDRECFSGRAILFIDEIHRFSKSQQDSLLGAVEKGLVTLIGATTENPSSDAQSDSSPFSENSSQKKPHT